MNKSMLDKSEDKGSFVNGVKFKEEGGGPEFKYKKKYAKT